MSEVITQFSKSQRIYVGKGVLIDLIRNGRTLDVLSTAKRFIGANIFEKSRNLRIIAFSSHFHSSNVCYRPFVKEQKRNLIFEISKILLTERFLECHATFSVGVMQYKDNVRRAIYFVSNKCNKLQNIAGASIRVLR